MLRKNAKKFDENFLKYWGLRHCVSCPEDARPKRFSWFFYWIPTVQKCEHLVELGKCCKINYLFAKIGFDTAENEPSKSWQMLPNVPCVCSMGDEEKRSGREDAELRGVHRGPHRRREGRQPEDERRAGHEAAEDLS